jgi:hypothetical protein
MCGGEGEKKGTWGQGKRAKNGAVDSEHGTNKDKSLLHHIKSHHSKKEGYF